MEESFLRYARRDPVAEVKAFYGDGWVEKMRAYAAAAKIRKGNKVGTAMRDSARRKRWRRIESMSTDEATEFMKTARYNAFHVANAKTPHKAVEVQRHWADEWGVFEQWRLTRGLLASSCAQAIRV